MSAEFTDAPPRRPLPFGWLLFTAVWLVFPAGFVVQVLRTDLSPVGLLAFLASMTAFVGTFVWLMLRYPFPAATTTPGQLRVRIWLLLALAALGLYIELTYNGGVPYRLMYVVIAAAVTLPTRYAAGTIVAVTICAGAIYATRSEGGAFMAGWQDVVPFALIGVGMITVSRLVITVRELQAARREIAQLAAAEAVTSERLRFARDLHDLLGHSLSSITLKSELAGRLLSSDPERAAKEVGDIEGVARQALREVREAVAGYRQPTLENELAGAREMLGAAGIVCRAENGAGPLPGATDSVLAWTVREGTTNVMRHSRASSCQILLTRDGEKVYAKITDDGGGPPGDPGESAAGSGLSGLAERVAALPGGEFGAGPLPGGGFRLRVGLPVADGRGGRL